MKRLLIILFLLILAPLSELNAQINHKHYVLMGKLELSKENYAEAIKNFNIAIVAKPRDFEGSVNRIL